MKYGELKRHFHSLPCFHKSVKDKLYSDTLWWLFRYIYLLNELVFCIINTDQGVPQIRRFVYQNPFSYDKVLLFISSMNEHQHNLDLL